MLFRCAFKELLKGRHPDDKNWETHNTKPIKKVEPIPHDNKTISLDNQRKLINIFSESDLKKIQESCKHPDWLGYLGLALYHTQGIEKKKRILTKTWIPQLLEITDPPPSVKSHF